MAQQRGYGKYQYETSPRKVKPEYAPPKSPYKKKPSTVKTEKKQPEKKKASTNIKSKAKWVLGITVVFVMLLAIGYRNSLINEKFSELQDTKKQLSILEKENEQLEVNIQSMLNLNNIEQSAKELLGMQKLDNSQKKYISLDKKDYVEKATEEVKIEEEKNIIVQLIDMILGNV